MRIHSIFLCICAALVLSIPHSGADESARFDDTPILFAVPRINIHDDGHSTSFFGGIDASVAWPISLRTNVTASHFFNISGSGYTNATYNYDTYLDKATLLRGSFGIFDDEIGFGVLAHRPLLKYGLGAYINHANDQWQGGLMLSAPIRFGVTAAGVNSALKLSAKPDSHSAAGVRHIVAWHENMSGSGWGLHTSAAYLPTRPPSDRISRVENTPAPKKPTNENADTAPQPVPATSAASASPPTPEPPVAATEIAAAADKATTVDTPKTIAKSEPTASAKPASQTPTSAQPAQASESASNPLPSYKNWGSSTTQNVGTSTASSADAPAHDDFPAPTAGKNVSPGAVAPANDGQAATAANSASQSLPNAAAQTAHAAVTPAKEPVAPAANTDAAALTAPLTPTASPGKPVEFQPRNDPLHLALLIEPNDGDAPLLLTNRAYAYVAGTVREPHTVQSLRVNTKPVQIGPDGEFLHLEQFSGPGQHNIVITATSTVGLTSQRVRKVRALRADEVDGPDAIRIITLPRQDSSLITFTFGQGGEIPGQRIVAQLQNASGAIVQHWAQSGAGPMIVTWDGFDITQCKASPGEYTAIFAVMVGDQMFAQLRQPFVFDY